MTHHSCIRLIAIGTLAEHALVEISHALVYIPIVVEGEIMNILPKLLFYRITVAGSGILSFLSGGQKWSNIEPFSERLESYRRI